MDKALAQAWQELDERSKERYEENLEEFSRQGGAAGGTTSSPPGGRSEDVDMEGTEENGEGVGGGFTAVNR
jgi:hypothetical protein